MAEFLVWGSGWLIWKTWNRGLVRLALWGLWMATILVIIPAVGTALGAALAAIPPLAFVVSMLVLSAEVVTVMIGLYIGARSARGLMKRFDEEQEPALDVASKAPASA